MFKEITSLTQTSSHANEYVFTYFYFHATKWITIRLHTPTDCKAELKHSQLYTVNEKQVTRYAFRTHPRNFCGDRSEQRCSLCRNFSVQTTDRSCYTAGLPRCSSKSRCPCSWRCRHTPADRRRVCSPSRPTVRRRRSCLRGRTSSAFLNASVKMQYTRYFKKKLITSENSVLRINYAMTPRK